MRRFAALLRTELTVVMRNNFPWVMLAVLALSAGLVHVLPARVEGGAPRYLHDATGERRLEAFLEAELGPEGIVASRQALEQAVRAEREAVGILVEPAPAPPGGARPGVSITLVHNGEIPPRQLNTIEAGLRRLWGRAVREAAGAGEAAGTRGKVLTLRAAAEPIPLNKSVVPVLMVFEVIVLGFLFVAVTVFQEKQDGSIRAYRVSPGGTWTYILSKTAVWLLLTTAYGALLLAATMGFVMPWGRLLALTALSALFMTLVGLLVSVFFRSISEWFVVGVGILVINMLPQISYLEPAFSPAWITWIPSYPVLFAVRELLFAAEPGGAAALEQLRAALVRTGVSAAVVVPFVYWAVRARLMREAGS